jgi:hypothetical protein
VVQWNWGAQGAPGPDTAQMEAQGKQVQEIIKKLVPQVREVARWRRNLALSLPLYEEAYNYWQAQAHQVEIEGAPWVQGQRIYRDQEQVQRQSQEKLAEIAGEVAQAQARLARLQDGEAQALAQLDADEQELLNCSDADIAGRVRGVRAHISYLEGLHTALLGRLGEHQRWLRSLAAVEDRYARYKIAAAGRLGEEIDQLLQQVTARAEATTRERQAMLWPASSGRVGHQRTLVPIWILRYRPWGRRSAPRLLVLTPGIVRAMPQPRLLHFARGFHADLQPSLARRFHAHMLAGTVLVEPATQPLTGENHLAASTACWPALAARGWVSGWRARLR